MKSDLKILKATVSAQGVLLSALAATHPDREHLRYVFGRLMNSLIESVADPEMSGALQSCEEDFRAILDGAGVDKPPPGYRPPP
jgi:hypothetical protein